MLLLLSSVRCFGICNFYYSNGHHCLPCLCSFLSVIWFCYIVCSLFAISFSPLFAVSVQLVGWCKLALLMLFCTREAHVSTAWAITGSPLVLAQSCSFSMYLTRIFLIFFYHLFIYKYIYSCSVQLLYLILSFSYLNAFSYHEFQHPIASDSVVLFCAQPLIISTFQFPSSSLHAMISQHNIPFRTLL